uniref:KU70 protein n=1 Tax=Trypanosoma brucei TaxID=5691 RepID=Q95PL9_9TRYP|nr:KU70 protein [Trypanosoma brucei]
MAHYDEWLMSVDGLDFHDEDDSYFNETYATEDEPSLRTGSVSSLDQFDVVLCLVDFQQRMFQGVVAHDCKNPFAGGAEQVYDDITEVKVKETPTVFEKAICCVQQLYKDKGISDSNDMVALVLYNTRECTHPDYPGVYVFHTFCSAEIQSVLDLEELVAAGRVPSAGYENIVTKIGHSTEAKSHLGDALRAARHLFSQLPSEVKHRRIFLFTNDVNPHRGDEELLQKCAIQIESLSSGGVGLVCYDMSPTALPSPAASTQSGEAAAMSERWATQFGGVDEFWSALTGAVPKATNSSRVGTIDIVHLNSDDSVMLGALSTAVRWRTHPRGASQTTTLTIGVGAKGSALPRLTVGMYFPMTNAQRRLSKWLDGRAGEMVMLRQRAVGVGAPILLPCHAGKSGAPPAHISTGQLGKSRPSTGPGTCPNVPLSCKKHIAEVVGAGLTLGFSIICFKNADDVLHPQYVLGKSCVLHPDPQDGSDGSLRLFIRLARALKEQRKVAMAQHITRYATPPRLVALVPPGLNGDHVDTASFPVMHGLGLYVVPLSYADDVRTTPRSPLFGDATKPMERDIALAQRLLATLPSKYNVNVVPNPALELRYKAIESIVQQTQQQSGLSKEIPGVAPFSQLSKAVDRTWGDRGAMAKYGSVFDEFKAVLLPSYNRDETCGPKTKAARNVKARAELADEDIKGVERIISAVESAFRFQSMGMLTEPQLKEYLRVMEGGAFGVRRNPDIIQAVISQLQGDI